MIHSYCKQLKYKREIVLVTNGHGYYNGDDMDQILAKVKDDNIKLTIMYEKSYFDGLPVLTLLVELISMTQTTVSKKKTKTHER